MRRFYFKFTVYMCVGIKFQFRSCARIDRSEFLTNNCEILINPRFLFIFFFHRGINSFRRKLQLIPYRWMRVEKEFRFLN